MGCTVGRLHVTVPAIVEGMSVLQACDLHKRYARGDTEVTAVAGVSLTLERGAFVALVGPSGCGKSTLLHLCGAMDRPTAGEVRLDGRSLADLDDDALTRVRRTRIGFVFQTFNLLPTLTVGENVGLPLLLAGRDPREVTTRVGEWAERVGISHRLDHVPAQLSGGEAQRTAIARAVVHDPVLLLADEPTGNLDSANGRRIVELVHDVNRSSGAAVLLVTHDPTVAAAAALVLEMRDGRLVAAADAKPDPDGARGASSETASDAVPSEAAPTVRGGIAEAASVTERPAS
ncbi:MAG: ABC transporter ATP-binding protein [Acidobacteria bacterium]|nr:ABC transporter ATP-binding protein [Acidobacteriota bacterium]